MMLAIFATIFVLGLTTTALATHASRRLACVSASMQGGWGPEPVEAPPGGPTAVLEDQPESQPEPELTTAFMQCALEGEAVALLRLEMGIESLHRTLDQLERTHL